MRVLVIPAAVAALVGLAGCAIRGPSHNVDYTGLSARLFIAEADGTLLLPLGGRTLAIDEDIGLGPDAIRLAPGHRWIRGIDCPPPARIEAGTEVVVDGEDATSISYSPPTHGFSLGHDFEIGRAYLLRCVDGYPEIVPYDPAGSPARLHLEAGEGRSIDVDGVAVDVLPAGVEIAPGPHLLGGLCEASAPIVERAADGDVTYLRTAISWSVQEVLESGRDYDVRCVEINVNRQSTLLPSVEPRK